MPSHGAATPAVAAVVGATVTWNGNNVSSAGSPSSALSISKGQTALVVFTFSEGLASYITNATLQVTYLGIVLTTSRAAPHVVGGPPVTAEAQINWSFGPLYDALEGVFQFTASLQTSSGSNAWSESFYVFAKAPYLLESGAPVVLLVLTVAELYWGLSAIREARKEARPPAAGAGAPPTGAPATQAPSTPPMTPDSGSGTPPPPAGPGGPS